jgi:outer membrane lipoprotein-sorting protein
MKTGYILFVLAMTVGLISVPLSSSGLDSKEILLHADEARGNLEGVQWKVHIHSLENGRVDERDLDVKAKAYDFVANLTAPPKVKGQKLLMIDRNMWFVKLGVKKPVPIAPKQKLIGGAAYGDIAATNYSDEYKALPLEDQTLEGEGCHVFDLVANDKKATYERIKYWVSKKRLVGVKAEYYTVSGKMFKSALFEYDYDVQLGGKPHPFISKMTITDAIINTNVTTMNFSEPKLVNVPDSAFDLNLLMTR